MQLAVPIAIMPMEIRHDVVEKFLAADAPVAIGIHLRKLFCGEYLSRFIGAQAIVFVGVQFFESTFHELVVFGFADGTAAVFINLVELFVGHALGVGLGEYQGGRGQKKRCHQLLSECHVYAPLFATHRVANVTTGADADRGSRSTAPPPTYRTAQQPSDNCAAHRSGDAIKFGIL